LAASAASVAVVAVAAAASVAAVAADAAADPGALQRGQQVYTRCAACHAIEGNRTGPQHCGLFGRRAGTAPGYDGYSPAMRASGIVWDARTLDRFLAAPTDVVRGTTMGYAGIHDPRERADLIAWLRDAARPGGRCRVIR